MGGEQKLKCCFWSLFARLAPPHLSGKAGCRLLPPRCGSASQHLLRRPSSPMTAAMWDRPN
eukprot:2683789-Amphidinium_carterae.1